jgi:hypothetical protein
MVSAWPYTLKDGTRASTEIIKPGVKHAAPSSPLNTFPTKARQAPDHILES